MLLERPIKQTFSVGLGGGRGGVELGLIFAGYVCHWPLRAPNLLQSILWPFIDPILVTFGQICHFRDPSLLTKLFYELTHFQIERRTRYFSSAVQMFWYIY